MSKGSQVLSVERLNCYGFRLAGSGLPASSSSTFGLLRLSNDSARVKRTMVRKLVTVLFSTPTIFSCLLCPQTSAEGDQSKIGN